MNPLFQETPAPSDDALKTFGCGLWQCSNLNEHTQDAIRSFTAGFISCYNGLSHNWKKSPFALYDREADHPFYFLQSFAAIHPTSPIKTAAKAFVQEVLPRLPNNAETTMTSEFYDVGIKPLSECTDNASLALQYIYGYLTAHNSAAHCAYPTSWWQGITAKFPETCKHEPEIPLVRFAYECATTGS